MLLQFVLISTLILPTLTDAAGLDEMGREFYVGFGTHGSGFDFLHFLAPSPANITVNVPGRAGLITRSLQRQEEFVLQLSSSEVQLPLQSGVFRSRLVYILSTADISTLAVSQTSDSLGARLVEPVDATGSGQYNRWIVSSFEPKPLSHGVLLITVLKQVTEFTDSINITLRLSNTLASVNYGGRSYRTGDVISITLAETELLQLIVQDSDFTGTEIVSRQTLSVVSSVRRTQVPIFTDDGDTVVESMTPVSRWGKEFVIAPFAGRDNDFTLVAVASKFNTWLTVQGSSHYLQRAETLQLRLQNAAFVVSSNPVALHTFAHSLKTDYRGEAAMLSIIPIDQYKTGYFFTTPHTSNFKHYISLVAIDYQKDGLLLDGNAVRSNWTVLPKSIYVVTSLEISQGVHSVSHRIANTHFGVSVYGFRQQGGAMGYAYPAGMRLRRLDQCIYTQDQIGDGIDNDCDGLVDEEEFNCFDDDNDGSIDEDVFGPGTCGLISQGQCLMGNLTLLVLTATLNFYLFSF